MSRLIALLLSAILANPNSSPVLQQVCEDIRPEATPGETLGAALAAAKKPPPCDLNADKGICLFGQTRLYADTSGGASIVPFEATFKADATERLIYVYTAFDTNAGDTKRTADLYFDGNKLAVGLPADEPIYVEGYLRLVGGGWHHIALVRGKDKIYSTTELPGTIKYEPAQTAYTDVSIGGDSAGQHITSRSRVMETVAEVKGTMQVFYTTTVE